MKKAATLILMIMLYTVTVFSQATGNPNSWDFYIIKHEEGGFKLFPGASVVVYVTYKDSNGIVIFKESLSGTLDDISHKTFHIGTGENPDPPKMPDDFYKKLHTICWDAIVNDGMADILISGMDIVSPVPASNVAAEAINAEQFSGHTIAEHVKEVPDIISKYTNLRLMLQEYNNEPPEKNFSMFPIDMFMTFDKAPSAVTGNDVDVVNLGTGLHCATNFGKAFLDEIESLYSIWADDLNNEYNVVGVTNKAGRHANIAHNTAAIYANNLEPELSAGVNAKAATWGLFGTANNGAVGVSNGGGNGAGVWGAPSQAPDAGGYKYAVLGDARSFTGAWAGAFFGSGFYTGTWTMSSDARLKTEIRSQTNALDKIMKLRPANYNYRQDTPYGLPQGLHHGFIAQEVEEVLPELVSDITMPLSLDPQDMHTSGTTSYKGINYIEMISILTGALQELNTTLTEKIDAQAAEIAELKKLVQHK